MNGVNKIDVVNFNINFKQAYKNNEVSENVSFPAKSKNLNGINALGNYNLSFFNVAKSADIKTLPLICDVENIDEIADGEKIYTSDNKLICVKKEKDNTVIIYYPDKENSQKINQIDVNDKETGNCIKRQYYTYVKADKYDDAYTYIDVTEYNPINGKDAASTSYKNGKFYSSSKILYKPNGSETYMHKYSDGTFYISQQLKGRSRYIDFDNNNQIKYVEETYESENKTFTKRAMFYKGGLVSVEKFEKGAVLNNMGIDKINVPELSPSPMFITDKDYKGLDGEKTYYSNGMIESNKIKTKDGVEKATFDVKGNIQSIEIEDKKYEFKDNKGVLITETLGDGKTKETAYRDSELLYVKYIGDGREKEVYYVEGKPRSYSNKNINDEDDWEYLTFTKNGMLIDS